MGHESGYPIRTNAVDFFRQQEKDIQRVNRTPVATSASDLLGPGFSSHAVRISDWNDEIATSNGYFYTIVGAYNAPVVLDESGTPLNLNWSGLVIAREDGSGMQQVWSTDDPVAMHYRVRNFRTNPADADAPPIFEEWRRFATPTGLVGADDLGPDVTASVQDQIDTEAARIDADITAIKDLTITGTALDLAIDDAINRANAAQTSADAAQSTANTALTSANGKNKVTHSFAAPGTTPNTAGDTWFQYKEAGLINIKAVWRGAGGTTWNQSALDTTIIPQIDIGVGTFGTLSGLRVNAAELVIGQSQVTGLTASISGARTGAVSDIKTLWGLPSNTTLINGGVIATDTILAESLLLSDFTDYVRDPNFNLGLWSSFSATKVLVDTTGPDGTTVKAVQFIGNSTSQTVVAGYVPVQPGDSFDVSFAYKHSGAPTTATLVGQIVWKNAAGVVATMTLTAAAIGTLAANTWATYRASGVIPNGAVEAYFRPTVQGTLTTGSIYVTGMHARRRFGGELLVDGAVQARHFTGDTFKGVVMSAPLIQTSETANRGLKIVSSANGSFGSLVTYDSAGSPTLTINGQTGAVVMKGDLTSGSTVAGAAVTGGTVTGATVQTAVSGNRIVMRQDVSGGLIEGWTADAGQSVASTIDPELVVGSNTGLDRCGIGFDSGSLGSGGRAAIVLSSGTRDGSGVPEFTVFPLLHGAGGATFGGDIDVAGTATAEVFSAFGEVLSAQLGMTSPGSTTNAANVQWFSSSAQGYLRQVTSSRRVKTNIRPVVEEYDPRLLLRLGDVLFTSLCEGDDPDEVQPGFIAEDAHDLGLTPWVIYEEDGVTPLSFKYDRWPAALQVIVRDLQRQIDELTDTIRHLTAL